MAPFVYRRMITRATVRPTDIEPFANHVLAAFSRVPTPRHALPVTEL